jgi:hypothetical protein
MDAPIKRPPEMVKTTDYFYPNYRNDHVMVILKTVHERDKVNGDIVVLVMGEGDFGLKKYFTLADIADATRLFDTIVNSDPNVNALFDMGLISAKEKRIKAQSPPVLAGKRKPNKLQQCLRWWLS